MKNTAILARGAIACLALTATVLAGQPAFAGYVSVCQCQMAIAVEAASEGGASDAPSSEGPLGIRFLEQIRRVALQIWEPGTNSASKHGFSPPAGPGTPGAATYSIQGAGFVDVSGFDLLHGDNQTVDMTALGVPGLATADGYADVIDWALNQWGGVSGFTNLGRVADGAVDVGAAETVGGHLGDIRVAAFELTAPTTLGHAFQPGTELEFGAGGTVTGDIHFDVDVNWIDDPTATLSTDGFDFRSIALHEVGHALGLGHSTDLASVMNSSYWGARRSLTPDDILGIQAIYGVPEPSTGVLLLTAVIASLASCRRNSPRFRPHSERAGGHG